MRSFVSGLAVIATVFSALPTYAAPASGSSPSFALRSYETTDASTASPFKRLLTADICAKIDLVIEHEIYICTPETNGVVASDLGPDGNIATPFANVKHGVQSSGADDVTYVDQKMNPPINPLAPPIGAAGKDFVGGQQGGNNFPGGNGATFTGPPESESITGVGKTRPQKRITTYAAVPGGQFCALQTKEKLTLKVDVCICISAGVLTDAAKQAIRDAVNDPANAQIITLLTTALNGHTDFPNKEAIIEYLEQYALDLVGSKTTTCKYPQGSIPDSCDDCHSHCPENQYKCGDQCIPDDQDCKSDLPVLTKRDFLSGPDVKCPAHLTACGIHSTSFFTGRNFECIDTLSNIESCGACAFPLPGQPIGIDCTALPHTSSVTCHLGQCIVDDCERGFELNAEGSGCVPAERQTVFSQKRKTKKALKARQVRAESLRGKR